MKKTLKILCIAVTGASLMLSGCSGGEDDYGRIMQEEVAGEITVSCYDSMQSKAFLEESAKAFEEKYPGTKVNVEAFSAMPEIKVMEDGEGMSMAMITRDDDYEQEKDDYISKVNTELMSGKGADVLAIDVLPYYKYADNGTLEDMNGFIDADGDFSMSDYFENIIEATQYKDGQYILPIDCQYDYLAYDSSLFGSEEEESLKASDQFTYQELTDMAIDPFYGEGASTKIFGLTAYTERGVSMFSQMFGLDYKSYIDIEAKKAMLDDGRFAALLETVSEYGEAGYIEKSSDSIISAKERLENFSPSVARTQNTTRYFYKVKNSFSLLQHFNKGNGTGNMIMSIGGADSGNEEDDEPAGLIAGSEGEVPFTFSQAYGINSNSLNKRTAWEFVKFLLCEEIQSSPQLSVIGQPVNKNALMSKANMMITGEFGRGVLAGSVSREDNQAGGREKDENMKNPDKNASADDGSEPERVQGEGTGEQSPDEVVDTGEAKTLTKGQEEALENYLAASEKYTKMLNSYMVRDEKIDAMIQAEVGNYFNGTKTAEEVANALQSKVELYLNE